MTIDTHKSQRQNNGYRDGLRQVLTVLTAITNPLASQLPQLTGTGRSIEEQSEISRTLLVPWAPAFAIWAPIFLGLILYAVWQALPRNRERPLFRAIGWYLIAAMGLSTMWALAASYTPVDVSAWLTAVIFTPYAVVAALAMVKVSDHVDHLQPWEKLIVWAPTSLFAGWTSLAVFINWEQVFTNQAGLPAVPVALLLLTGALLWIVWNLRRSDGNWVYALAGLWGLAFAAYARLVIEGSTLIVGYAAIAGFVVIVIATRSAQRIPE